MLKLILLPFTVTFAILRFIFFPWYLRWIFRLNWAIYIILAAVAGYFTLALHDDYRAEVAEAQVRANERAPTPVLLSEWTLSDLNSHNEVAVQGLFFTGLPQGKFDRSGAERSYLLVADDLGKEVKAALIVPPNDALRLRRQMLAQGAGDAITVTVRGTLDRTLASDVALRAELMARGLPLADELIIIEPFLGSRRAALRIEAEESFAAVTGLGAIAGLLAILGLGKYAMGLGATRRSSATQSQMPARAVLAAKQAKQASQKALPSTAAASPWGTFKPVDSNVAGPVSSEKVKTLSQKALPKPKAQQNAKSADQTIDAAPQQPEFQSVFPSGGSGFKFKSADEIIRQTFGTLSSVNKVNRDSG